MSETQESKTQVKGNMGSLKEPPNPPNPRQLKKDKPRFSATWLETRALTYQKDHRFYDLLAEGLVEWDEDSNEFYYLFHQFNKLEFLSCHESTSNGYTRVLIPILGSGEGSSRIRKSRAVKIAATGLPDPLLAHPEINHKDGDKSNDSPDNLEWSTRSANILHAISLGSWHQHKVTRQRKLSDSEILTLRLEHEQGTSLSDLAKKYDVSAGTAKKWLTEPLRKIHHRSKCFELMDPNGRLHKGINLKAFCEEQGLVYNTVQTAHHKGVYQMKSGWRIPANRKPKK